jgi:hypothetical protein
MEQHLLAIIEKAESPFQKLSVFAEFQIYHAAPEHVGLNLESGLSAQVRARIDGHTKIMKAALEKAIKSGMEKGEFSEMLIPAIASELVWGLVQGGVEAALLFPEQKPHLLATVVKVLQALISPTNNHSEMGPPEKTA